jgi:hypothetical protein
VRAECVRSASECVRVRQRLRVRYRLSECVRVRYRASECVRVRYRASECGTVRYRAVLCNILILSFNWLVEGSERFLWPHSQKFLTYTLTSALDYLVKARTHEPTHKLMP